MCCKSPKALCITSIICFVLTAIFVALAIAIPIYIQNYIDKEATDSVQLRQDNFQDWRQLPGNTGIKVFRDYKLYDCNNTLDIYYNGAQPVCYELPAVTFYEHQYYTDANWQKLQVPDFPGRIRDAVDLEYKVNQIQVSDNSTLDRTINVANQALFGVWYGATHQTTFSLAFAGLWSAYNGLQTDLVNQVAVNGMIQFLARYQSQDGFNQNIPTTTLTSQQLGLLWTDVNYGFNNADVTKQAANLLKWMEICPDFKKTEKQQITRKNDIKTYFGLDKEQITSFQTVLCTDDLTQGLNIAKLTCGDETAGFKQVCAYKQWSQSTLTQLNTPPAISVVNVDPTLAGYPEMNYFLIAELKSYLDENVQAQIFENQFESLDFKTNYAHLFVISGVDGMIPTNSLFYYATMEKLIEIGQAFKPLDNIVIINGKDFIQLSSFSEIMTTLELPDFEHAYILYLYLKVLADEAVVRKSKGGYMEVVGLANFASAGLTGIMESLFQYTLPRALYGIMVLSTHGADIKDCQKIAKIYFSNAVVQGIICSPQASTIAINSITGIYFWTQAFQARTTQITNVLTQLGITQNMISDFLQETGPFGTALDTAMKAIKNHYFNTAKVGCTITGANSPYCSDFELGYQQFVDGAITNNLPTQITTVFPVTNTKTLAGFASLLGQSVVPPEYSYFLSSVNKESDLKGIGPQDIYNNYPATMANLGLIQQQFIAQNSDTIPFGSDAWRDYLRYVVLEFAFNGLFIKKTVRDILFGYEDTLIQTIVDTPVYAGGDPTQNPLLQIIAPDSKTSLAFFTGVGDSNYTQVYAKYNDSPTISIPGIKRKNNGTEFDPIQVNPWREQVPLKGTDASKFHPLLDEGQSIWAFVSDLMLPLRFLYKKEQEKHGLQVYRYTLDQQMLQVSSKYPPNQAYYIDKYDGFGNMTSLRGAKLFASQAHFYDVPQQYDLIKSIIRNSEDGTVITPSQDNDLSYFKLEKYSGGQVEGYQRITLNVFSEHDILFNMTTTNNNFSDMIPLIYVTRYTSLTDSQIDDLFGTLKLGVKVKLALLIVFPILAGIFFILGITLLICRRKRLKAKSYTMMVG